MLPAEFRNLLRKLIIPGLLLGLLAAGKYGWLWRWFQCAVTGLRYGVNREGIQTANLPPPLPGNQAELLVNGPRAFAALQTAIAAARHSIRWQVMLFEADEAGMALAAQLAAAARRGVRVALSFDMDQVGNGTVVGRRPPAQRDRLERMLSALREAGVAVRSSSPGARRTSAALPTAARALFARVQSHRCLPANHYDHRKLLIIDEQVAFVGGMNVGDHYLYSTLDAERETSKRWLDCMVRLEGPVVAEITAEFDWTWQALGGDAVPVRAAEFAAAGPIPVQFLRQHPGVPEIGARFFALVQNARREIYVASPFVSYRPAITALANAARRGVRVIFITPYAAQVMSLSRWVFDGSAADLQRAGVEVLYNNQRMAHTKLLVVDRRWTLAGSFNLNYRSFLHDAEDAICLENADFAGQVIEQIFAPYQALSQPAALAPARPNLLRWLVRPFS